MLLPICILVTSDPATSDNPAEAIRIAAALGGWGQLQVVLCLSGPATRILLDPPSRGLERQLQSISDVSGPILLNEAETTADYNAQRVTIAELAERLSAASYVLRF